MKRFALVFSVGLFAVPAIAADPAQLSAKIDQYIDAGYKANGVTPAPLADDAEFLRRVYLDLAGRIPQVADVRTFLADKNPNKRRLLVQDLLGRSGYVQHFGNLWRREWLPQTVSNPQFQFLGTQFEPWIRDQLRNNTPYDKIVREILIVPPAGMNQFGGQGFDSSANAKTAFLQVNEMKPENVASAASRLFLGVKLECAQCHDHPFETYSRVQFWEFASFFAGLQPIDPRGRRAPAEAIEIRALTIPGTQTKVAAKFLDGKMPEFKEKISPRVTLADWMTAPNNPYFARNAVNRMWANFFGTGLIDPLDEPGEKNPASHPELLDAMAKDFAASGYDMKYLIGAIAGSRAYQLSSAAPGASATNDRTFSRMRVRGLTPEQLFDSLAVATYFGDAQNPRQFTGMSQARSEFLGKFATTERLSETQTSILQALTLMNGRLVGDLTSVHRSNLLSSVIEAPFFDTAQRIEALFLATVTRSPRADELKKLSAYVDKAGSSEDSKKALADVFWALLNSSEFAFNH